MTREKKGMIMVIADERERGVEGALVLVYM
jgi:hypothetical protein